MIHHSTIPPAAVPHIDMHKSGKVYQILSRELSELSYFGSSMVDSYYPLDFYPTSGSHQTTSARGPG